MTIHVPCGFTSCLPICLQTFIRIRKTIKPKAGIAPSAGNVGAILQQAEKISSLCLGVNCRDISSPSLGVYGRENIFPMLLKRAYGRSESGVLFLISYRNFTKHDL